LAAWNAHDVERVAALYAPDCESIDVAEPAPQHGREEVRASVARYLSAFPDLLFTQEEAVVDGNRVAVVWMATGTHQGSLMHIPPTGRKVTVRGTSFLTVVDGMVSRDLSVWDVAGLLRAIGLLPDL
jgi:steroid delta-isomerase-like uncharacterized protein